MFKVIFVFVFIFIQVSMADARSMCAGYLAPKSFVFVLQADNFSSEKSLLDVHWSMLEAGSLDVDIQRFIPGIIDYIFRQNTVVMDEALGNLYTFVGAPKIEISIQFKPTGDGFSGRLNLIRSVYNNRSEMTDFYFKKYGSVESAFFQGGINSKDLLPWRTAFYFNAHFAEIHYLGL